EEKVEGYYLDASGVWIPNRVQKAQWVQSGNRWWYQEKDGSYPKLTWKTISGVWYYFDKDGWMLTGWQKINGSWYYMETSGRMTTGWQKIKNVWYYLNNSGQMLTGWQKVSGSWYLLDGSGKMLTGWQQNGGSWYYMESSGRMMTGWQKLSGTWYYLKADGKMVTGWQTIGNYKYYFKSSGAMASSTTVDGIVLNAEGQAIESTSGTGTIRGLIETALEPVGETLYVYGGGHDGSKGGDAVRIGVNPQWKKFYDQQGSSYDYTKYRYWHGYGLDCSGLVGWSIYNTLNKEANKSDYSSTSTVMPQMLANRGLGTVTTAAAAFKAGDVVSKSGHVWLIVGSCSDGSVVLIHATPPVVQISGTVAADGTYNSEAVVLAKKYMNLYYPDASKKFNLSTGDKSYLTNVNHFSWSNSSMKDPDGFRNMTADEVLKKIYG
ncbi:MAG: N-acetylmuramoyl-L-alanine amidase family protein, partial [Clostridia bacterium]|nr:N-acetylmuramoyl-L-alanine amidase family protein [Clostridia bacterium]